MADVDRLVRGFRNGRIEQNAPNFAEDGGHGHSSSISSLKEALINTPHEHVFLKEKVPRKSASNSSLAKLLSVSSRYENPSFDYSAVDIEPHIDQVVGSPLTESNDEVFQSRKPQVYYVPFVFVLDISDY